LIIAFLFTQYPSVHKPSFSFSLERELRICGIVFGFWQLPVRLFLRFGSATRVRSGLFQLGYFLMSFGFRIGFGFQFKL
jgi:hypothetical protein